MSFFALIYYILISTSIITNTNGDTISTNADHQYENETIYCTPNEPCNILCRHDNGCKSTEIYCPRDNSCDITCDANTACANTIIHAQYSSSFKLIDCATGSFTCKGITIYFPPNNKGIPRAKIIGPDRGLSAGEELSNPLQFYAINGWNDINITTGNEFSFQYHSGVMYCTSNLQTSCDFDTNAWKCANTNDICNNPPTISPTISPTYTPIKQMSTTETESEKQNDEIDNNNDDEYIPTTQSEAIITTTTLYIIIAFLLIFLCCFGSILLYYIYYSQAYAQRLAHKSMTRISNKNNIPSLSMKSNAISHSPINTTSPISKYSNSTMPNISSAPSMSSKSKNKQNNIINNINNNELIPIKNKQDHNLSSSDTESDNKQLQIHNNNPNSPWSYFTNNQMQIQQQQQQQQQHYIQQLMVAQAQLQQQQQQQQQQQPAPHIINMNIPDPRQQKYQISIPSESLITNSLSSNQQQIRYQQPINQHHMLQMMSMMNQSQPPSLSSFINNNNNGNNNNNNNNNSNNNMDQSQGIIPPSISNTPNNSQRYLQPRKITITSSCKDGSTNDDLFKVPPPESIITGLTSCTGTDDDNISDSDGNIYTLK